MAAPELADDRISTSTLHTSLSPPPASMRSSESVFSQVHDTLMEMVKRPKHIQQERNSEDAHKKRTNEAFLERLQTFSVSNWMGKPLCLSPPLLAQYGWQCIGEDTIKCCSCSSIIYVQLPLPCAGNYREQCYLFRKRIIDSHMKICSWPSYPCSDTLVTPFLNGVQNAPKTVKKFCQRRDNLSRLGSKLPRLANEVLSEMNLNRNDLTSMVSSHSIESTIESTGDDLSRIDISCILAMCGWDTRDDEACLSPAIFCEFSGRSIKLHNVFTVGEGNYTSEESLPDHAHVEVLEGDLSEPSPKKSKIEVSIPPKHESPLKISKKFFHPLKQHCSWSHWVAVLKPISKEEFEANEGDFSRYQYVVNPFVANAEPSWKVLMQTLLGSKAVLFKSKGGNDTAKSTPLTLSDQKQLSSENSKLTAKLSPKKAVVDFHRLMAEITSKR